MWLNNNMHNGVATWWRTIWRKILITKTCSNDALDWHLCPLVRYGGGPPRFGGGGGSRGGPPMGKFGNPGERLRKKHWNLDELPKFQKNFYQEHPDTSHRPLVRPAHCCSVLQMFFPDIFSWLSKVEHKAVCTQLVLSLVCVCECLYIRAHFLLIYGHLLCFSKRLNNTDGAKK